MKIKIFFAVLAGMLMFSCSPKEDETLPPDPNPPIPYNADLKGSNETPPNQSTATGYANFFLNQYTKVLYGTVHYSGLDPTASHIHLGAPGVAGPVVFASSGPANNGEIPFNTAALDSSQIAKLDSGLYYVNVHSAVFPGGEIRGQLIRQK